jgi:hypothetical protein
MAPYIHDIRMIRLFAPFMIPSSDCITNGRMTQIVTGYFLASPLFKEPQNPSESGNPKGLCKRFFILLIFLQDILYVTCCQGTNII